MSITGNITKNFSLEEMACKDGTLIITPETVEHAWRLQKFREWYNRPMIINSWYRSPAHNAKVGGEKNSQHILGIACDIALHAEFKGYPLQRQNEYLSNIKAKWQELCAKDGLGGGVGYYKTFIHLDSRRVPAFWDNR